MLADRDLLSIQEARGLAEAAHQAQKIFETFPQEKVDGVVAEIAKAVIPEARRLAELAVQETGFGNVPDKTLKNIFCSEYLHSHIRDLKTVGIVREDAANKIVEIAVPVGVVCAIIPSTNPTSTTLFKALIALKSGNGIVFSPHPAAVQCINETARLLKGAALSAGVPEGLIGCLSVSTLEATRELMAHRRIGVILATGGMGLVRAAYSSGKPAYGVGPGNVPAFIERTADVDKAVKDIFAGTCFDYGTLCSSEQAMIVDRPLKDAVEAKAKELGGYFLQAADTEKLERTAVGPDGKLNPKIVGKSAVTIAEMAGLSVPRETKVLLIPLGGAGRDYPLSMEKLSPLLAYYVVDDWKQGCTLCKQILEYGGLGHTLGLHSNDTEVIRLFALEKPAFRIIVNSNTALGAVGYTTNLAPSMTLGCGTLGGNITSDNISPLHLLHVRRLAYETRPYAPSRRSHDVGHDRPPETLSSGGVDGLIEEYLRKRGVKAPRPVEAVTAPPAPAPAPPPEKDIPLSQPAPREMTALPIAEFVCEDDVRRALKDNTKIRIGSQTLLTPSARELGEAKGVFLEATGSKR